MWYLTSKTDSRVMYVLPGKDIVIGRSADGQNCNFAVPEDPSLSRKHATLSIVDNVLNLEDVGSKYGTFINDSSDKVVCNQKLILNVNDTVKFGKLNCEWTVQKADFVTCASTLKGENIQNLKNILNKLGGVYKSEWDNSCTYLTMPAITLTIKVVLALVQGSFIVTTEYWAKCLEAILLTSKLPDPANFTPQIIESTLNKETVSFVPDDSRKTLFAGKSMIFFSKRQLEMYRMVLEKSSATALLLNETEMSKPMLCADNIIVVLYNATQPSQEMSQDSQREQVKDIVNYLKSKGKRVVADAEIGLAILYCSLEKYCNPDFNFTMELMKQPTNQAGKVNNILAQESQNVSQGILYQKNIKIDESLSGKENSLSGNDELVIGKRKHSEDEVTTNKKIAIETTNNCGGKRTADHLEDPQTNPSKKIASDNDSFNFIQTSNKNTENNDKQLNFMKPMKRKIAQNNDEDGLFNFVSKKAATERNTDYSSTQDNTEDIDNDHHIKKSNKTAPIDDKVDLAALRGSKLSELWEQNFTMDFSKAIKSIKTENEGGEDFGSTVLVVRNDLVVKREPITPMKEETDKSTLKNFKKFKKVWPLKLQASMSKLSLSVV